MSSGLQIPLQIRFGDIDSYGHVNNVTYATYLEDARVQLTHQLLGASAGGGADPGQTLADLVGAENFTLVARQEIEYRAPLLFRTEPIYIGIWVTAVGGSHWEFSYTVGEKDGSAIYAHAASTIVLVNRGSGRPVRVSPAIRHALTSWLGDPVPFRRGPSAGGLKRGSGSTGAGSGSSAA